MTSRAPTSNDEGALAFSKTFSFKDIHTQVKIRKNVLVEIAPKFAVNF